MAVVVKVVCSKAVAVVE
jgi:hypothetical protein